MYYTIMIGKLTYRVDVTLITNCYNQILIN